MHIHTAHREQGRLTEERLEREREARHASERALSARTTRGGGGAARTADSYCRLGAARAACAAGAAATGTNRAVSAVAAAARGESSPLGHAGSPAAHADRSSVARNAPPQGASASSAAATAVVSATVASTAAAASAAVAAAAEAVAEAEAAEAAAAAAAEEATAAVAAAAEAEAAAGHPAFGEEGDEAGRTPLGDSSPLGGQAERAAAAADRAWLLEMGYDALDPAPGSGRGRARGRGNGTLRSGAGGASAWQGYSPFWRGGGGGSDGGGGGGDGGALGSFWRESWREYSDEVSRHSVLSPQARARATRLRLSPGAALPHALPAAAASSVCANDASAGGAGDSAGGAEGGTGDDAGDGAGDDAGDGAGDDAGDGADGGSGACACVATADSGDTAAYSGASSPRLSARDAARQVSTRLCCTVASMLTHPSQAEAQSYAVFSGIAHKQMELAAASQRSDVAAAAVATYCPDVAPLLRTDGGALWEVDRPAEEAGQRTLEEALLRRAHRSAQVRAAAAEKQRRREAAERAWAPAAAGALTAEYARQYERRVAQSAAERLLAPRRPQTERAARDAVLRRPSHQPTMAAARPGSAPASGAPALGAGSAAGRPCDQRGLPERQAAWRAQCEQRVRESAARQAKRCAAALASLVPNPNPDPKPNPDPNPSPNPNPNPNPY